MSEMEQPTRRLDEIKVDFGDNSDEPSYATLIVLRDKKVSSSVTLEEPITLIGRNPECTIPLITDTETSRQHAQIRFSVSEGKNREYFLMDLGSTNGTILNGNRIAVRQEVMLHDGDKFTIGHHLFKFALLDQSKEKFLSGNLTQISLFDLIQIIENNRLTCVLSIRSQGNTGRLFFNAGQIVDCELNDVRGMDGFRKMATVEEGFFEVEKCDDLYPLTIQAPSNMNLVLDTLREIDEDRAGSITVETEEEDMSLGEITHKSSPEKPLNEAMMRTTKVQPLKPPVES